MKKLFNYRPLVSICLFAMAGIIFVAGLYINTPLYIALSALSGVSLIVTVIVKAVKAREHRLFKTLSIVISFLLFSLATFLTIYSSANKNNYSGEYLITGRVSSDVYISTSGKWVVYLDDAYILDETHNDMNKLSGKVMLYLNDTDGRCSSLKLGTSISGVLNMYKPKLINNKTMFYYLNKNVHLVGSGSEDDINILNSDNIKLSERYKLRVKEVLNHYMDDEYSSLAYTMLFGDKAGLDEDIHLIYKSSGTAHLLAVSGLHIGFIVTLISFVLTGFKASDKVKFFVITPIIFLYALLCNFTVSVTRAFIMTMVLLYFKMRKKENDALSSLSLGALVILLVCPLHLYDVGFRLSFLAVLSIILLAKPLERFFNKFFHNKFSSALAISIATSVGIVPVMAYYFDNISIFSIVANLFAIPIASIAFMLMFVGVNLGVIFMPLGGLTFLFEPLMKVVTLIGKIMGSVNFAGANKHLVMVFSVLLLLAVICGCDYNFLKKKPKMITTTTLAVLTIVMFGCMFISV